MFGFGKPAYLSPDAIREKIVFFGKVQRVGFRFAVRRLAKKYGITGTVRNEPNGSVIAELQGTPNMINAVIYALHTDPHFRIDRELRSRIVIDPQERTFR